MTLLCKPLCARGTSCRALGAMHFTAAFRKAEGTQPRRQQTHRDSQHSYFNNGGVKACEKPSGSDSLLWRCFRAEPVQKDKARCGARVLTAAVRWTFAGRKSGGQDHTGGSSN
eukprot:3479904-Amphidinium_carterae.1